MDYKTNKTPQLHSQYFDRFDIHECIKKTLDVISDNLNNYYLSADQSELLMFLSNNLKQVNEFVNKDVRFNYLSIQNGIDNLHKEDSSISTVLIHLNFKDVEEKNEHIGHLKFKIRKS